MFNINPLLCDHLQSNVVTHVFNRILKQQHDALIIALALFDQGDPCRPHPFNLFPMSSSIRTLLLPLLMANRFSEHGQYEVQDSIASLFHHSLTIAIIISFDIYAMCYYSCSYLPKRLHRMVLIWYFVSSVSAYKVHSMTLIMI